MKKILPFALCLSMVGCVNTMATLKAPYQMSGSQVAIKDMRPKSQKSTENMSLMLSNCMYGSYQIGDKDQTPHRVKILQNYLSHHVGHLIQNQTVIVENFTMHINNAKGLRQSVSSVYGGGLLSDAIIDKNTIGCADSDLVGGYREDEVKDQFAPYITVIDININGQKYHARTVNSLRSEYWGDKNPHWNEVVQNAIESTAHILVQQIKANAG